MQCFEALGTFIVFFSFQWLPWDQAGQDAIQFNAMTESLKNTAARLRLGMDGICILLCLFTACAVSQSVLASEVPRTLTTPGSAVPQCLTSECVTSIACCHQSLEKACLSDDLQSISACPCLPVQ